MQDILEIRGQATLSPTDYADKYGISRRTVSRYIKQGKLEVFRRTGRTYIIDRAPTVPPLRIEPAKEPQTQDTKSGQLVKHQANYVYKLGQLSVQVKSGHRWKHLAIGLIVTAFFAAPGSVWLYSRWKDTAEAITVNQENVGRITADLATANSSIERLKADLFKSMATANTLAADAATAKSLKEVNQRLLETLGTTTQQLRQERSRIADLEATINQMSYLLGQTESERPTETLKGTADDHLRVIMPSEQFGGPN